jgi:hypothetical protein
MGLGCRVKRFKLIKCSERNTTCISTGTGLILEQVIVFSMACRPGHERQAAAARAPGYGYLAYVLNHRSQDQDSKEAIDVCR